MISEATRKRLLAAVNAPGKYSSGSGRKMLQATYDKLLDELSVAIFDEPCTNRMVFRQKINSVSDRRPIILVLKNMLKKQNDLFSKDYRDHSDEIEKFLMNEVADFLRMLRGE